MYCFTGSPISGAPGAGGGALPIGGGWDSWLPNKLLPINARRLRRELDINWFACQCLEPQEHAVDSISRGSVHLPKNIGVSNNSLINQGITAFQLVDATGHVLFTLDERLLDCGRRILPQFFGFLGRTQALGPQVQQGLVPGAVRLQSGQRQSVSFTISGWPDHQSALIYQPASVVADHGCRPWPF